MVHSGAASPAVDETGFSVVQQRAKEEGYRTNGPGGELFVFTGNIYSLHVAATNYMLRLPRREPFKLLRVTAVTVYLCTLFSGEVQCQNRAQKLGKMAV